MYCCCPATCSNWQQYMLPSVFLSWEFWQVQKVAKVNGLLPEGLIAGRVKLMQHNNHYYWSLLYSAILRSRADSLRSHVILHQWIAFSSTFLNIHRSGVLTALAWLVPQESAATESQSRHVLSTPYNYAPCHFMQSHVHKVYACLAVTCHLRFWQNDRGLSHATAVTWVWNGYQNKSQHRKLTLEKKILPPLHNDDWLLSHHWQSENNAAQQWQWWLAAANRMRPTVTKTWWRVGDAGHHH